MQLFFYLPPTGKLTASVACNCFYCFTGILGKCLYDCLSHSFPFSVRYLNCDIISRLSFRECCKTYFTFSLPRYHCICFPMSELFAVIYTFISLAYTFPRRKSSSVT